MTDHGPSRWTPMVGFVLIASANQMLWLNFTPITTGAAAHLAVSKSAIGWLSEMFPLLYVFLALPAGRALDRWFRLTLATGALLTAAGALLRLGGPSYGWVVAGQVVIALAQPPILNAITGTATRYLTDDHRPLGIALGSAGTFLGFILAFVLGGALGASRLHTILLVSGLYAVVAAVWLIASLRAAAPRESTNPVRSDASLGRIRDLWDDRVLRLLSVLVFLGFGVFIALTTWVETLLKPAGVSSGTTDTLLTMMVIAGVVGCVLIPPVAASRAIQPASIASGALAIAGACLVLTAVRSTVSASIALPVMGLLVLPVLPVILELAERRAGEAGGTATAVLWLAGNTGGIVVALLVQSLQSSPAAAFAVMATVGLIAVPLCLSLNIQLRARPLLAGEVLAP